MKRLILVRHGESAWNVEQRIQGQLGGGLTARGRRQSSATARVLAEAFPTARLAVSDLQRCRETIDPLEATLGRRARLDEGLRERDFGAWSGRLAEDLREDDPDRWRRWQAGEDVVGEVDGEDTSRFTKRVVTTLERLLGEVPDGADLICVTHGGPIWHGTCALVDLDEQVLGQVANASVTEILVDGPVRRLSAFNQVSHLPLELRPSLRQFEPSRPDVR